MNSPKRIGVLTSGGDCPGLNAVIRAVVKCASQRGWEVMGIPYGTDGLLGVAVGKYQPQDLLLKDHGYDVPGILQGLDLLQFLSGSVLGSLSKGPTGDPEVVAKILDGYRRLALDGLISIGGDGSLDIIYQLAQQGDWPLIAVPKTIDNDVPFTERSVGFDSAVHTVTRALYDLTFTAASHDRVMVVQVMGRDAGHLALHSGIAGGADAILIPERVPQLTPTVISQLCAKIAAMRQARRLFALIVVAEGVKDLAGQKDPLIADYVAHRIRDRACELCATHAPVYCDMDQVETRATVLGHIQRSGMPTASDRLLASAFGKKAVDLLAAEDRHQLVIWASGRVQTMPLSHVASVVQRCHAEHRCPSPVAADSTMVQVAQGLGIYIGGPGEDPGVATATATTDP